METFVSFIWLEGWLIGMVAVLGGGVWFGGGLFCLEGGLWYSEKVLL